MTVSVIDDSIENRREMLYNICEPKQLAGDNGMRAKLQEIISNEIRSLSVSFLHPAEGKIDESTRLYGDSGLLDSLGLVALTVAVEQAVEETFSVSISIASDRAMSRTRSPFRTAGSLTDWVTELVEEARGNA